MTPGVEDEPCIGCGRDVSPLVDKCPFCGERAPTWTRVHHNRREAYRRESRGNSLGYVGMAILMIPVSFLMMGVIGIVLGIAGGGPETVRGWLFSPRGVVISYILTWAVLILAVPPWKK